ncbi:hypothetical protein MT340_001215 [Staphylococcus sp. NRL 16/872]|nr:MULTISPECIES: hypothetical protein [unclassified Staphylococcus]MCJ1655391.1 hypothetical protein [Staphylococcus sp. NRL 21/187]MCJ1661226.1 hypothetical protein [Staphylococcus sp. NRL 18/288]MCJ1667116.1 hypothetical protein [Staphylococcus sp. NRL 19/737]WEN69598.1 hypothetical protein MT340_001215 [Staphylococcus sp. NRL 16/872]
MWIVASPPVSTHARKALFNHIMTWVCFALVPVLLVGSLAAINEPSLPANNVIGVIGWVAGIILGIMGVYLFIINIVRGIKLLLV